MNYSQPEDFEPRETDRRTDEPTHDTKMWNSSMLWEVGLILLVALVLVFCAWNFGAQRPGSRGDRPREQGHDVGVER